MGGGIVVSRIILLSGSRTGSHYICKLFNDTVKSKFYPELINKHHWPNKKRYIPTTKPYSSKTIFEILRKSENFITKYYTAYDISPEDILTFAKQNNVKFYFLYRKNNIETMISFLYMKYKGKATHENLQKAASMVVNNNTTMLETYNYFKPYIVNKFTYEDLYFDKRDLYKLDIVPKNTVYDYTKQEVSQSTKTFITTKKDLLKYLPERECIL